MFSPHDSQSAIRRFFTGAGLPLFILAVVLVYEAFLLAIVFAPDGLGAWGAFAREFKMWCLDYDARTGGLSWASAAVMLVEPLFVAAIAILLWRSALGTVAAWARHWRAMLTGVVVSSCLVGGLFAYGRPGNDTEVVLPFPGERIRTALAPPAFPFTDQHGHSFSLDQLHGHVVLMTGVYAMCSTSCPEILAEIRQLLDTLPTKNRARLSVVALTLNPEYETTELMQALAAGHGFVYPEFRYLNGDPAGMHDVLTRMDFSSYRDPVTHVINHANLFVLLDAEGRIAYRLTLDPRLRSWLRAAVLELTDEADDAARPARRATASAAR